MGSFITDLKNNYERGSVSLKFIYINIGIFVLTSLVGVVFVLFNLNGWDWMKWLELPAWLPQFAVQPWSLLTYMFLHANVLHLLFNMLWLYSFGQLFLLFFSARHFRGLYFLGGIGGGLLYILAFNVFPYFETYVYGSTLVGASASVLAIVVATAVRSPEYRVNMLFFGQVRLKYLALVMVLTDMLFVTSGNGGGHIAHLGGALAGWWFAAGLNKGTDVTKWINKVLDLCSGGVKLKRTPKKPKMKVNYGGRANDYEYNARKKERDDEIDRILDKVKQSGYSNLTTEEKKRLFDASKR